MEKPEIPGDVVAEAEEITPYPYPVDPGFNPNLGNELQSLVDLGKQALVTLAEQGNSERTLQMERLRIHEQELQFKNTAFKFKP